MQYLEKQGKIFFPGPFSDARFVGDKPSCFSGVRSTQGCHPLYKGGGKKTGSSPLLLRPLETSKPANIPQNVPRFTHRGYWCPQAEQQQTGSQSLPLQSRRDLPTDRWRESRTGKQKTPIPWGWENTFGKALEQNEGKLIKDQKPAARTTAPNQGDCQEQYFLYIM